MAKNGLLSEYRRDHGKDIPFVMSDCYDWVSSEKGKPSETGRSAELTFVQRDWS